MKTILILEDDMISCKMYEIYLSGQFEVHIATNAKDFMEFFEISIPDLCLIDVNIKDPDYTGLDLIVLVREKIKSLKTIFIVLSAYSERELSLPAGVSIYHRKPVDLPILMGQLKSALADAG